MKCPVHTPLVLLYYIDIIAAWTIDESEWGDLVELNQNRPRTLCEKGGKRQSPIDFKANDTITDFERVFIKYGRLKFYGYHNVLMTGVNDGKNIRYVADGDMSMRPKVKGGPLELYYYLTEVTFRFLSEHAIEGVKYPVEVQMVHIRADLNPSTARKHKDGFAILSIFANVSEPANITHRHPTDEVHDYLPELKQKGRLSGLLIDLRDILSTASGSYYTYMGSLTVPDCSEIVIWIVFQTPIIMTHESYTVITEDGQKPYNYRNVNELRRHMIYQPPGPFFSTPTAVKTIVTAVTDMVEFLKEVSNVVDKGMSAPK